MGEKVHIEITTLGDYKHSNELTIRINGLRVENVHGDHKTVHHQIRNG